MKITKEKLENILNVLEENAEEEFGEPETVEIDKILFNSPHAVQLICELITLGRYGGVVVLGMKIGYMLAQSEELDRLEKMVK